MGPTLCIQGECPPWYRRKPKYRRGSGGFARQHPILPRENFQRLVPLLGKSWSGLGQSGSSNWTQDELPVEVILLINYQFHVELEWITMAILRCRGLLGHSAIIVLRAFGRSQPSPQAACLSERESALPLEGRSFRSNNPNTQ